MLNDYLILTTIETFEATASHNFRKKPVKTDNFIYTSEYYYNYTDPASIRFFNNFGDGAYCRTYRNYTPAGYLINKVVTVSPYRCTKKVTLFEFIDKYKILKNAGFRETEIINNAITFKKFEASDRRCIEIFSGKKNNYETCIYDLDNNIFVG